VNRFRTAAALTTLGVLIAACGSSGSPSATATPTQVPSQAAQASAGGPGPSFTQGAVADLEAIIPDKVGDLTMQKQSMKGSQFLTSSTSSPEAIKFVQDLGVSPNDISIAIGSGYSTDYSQTVFAFVIRASGADSGKLVSVFKTASAAGNSSPLQWSSATVAGKSVETASSSGATNYLYVKGDVLIWMIATTPALAEQFIGQLP
jgi:hypothetical protein